MADSPFMADAGPTFDPERQAEPEREHERVGELHALPDAPPMWEEDSVRTTLRAKGSAIHAIAGVTDADWLYTAADLDAIAPPLTRILNRHDLTRAAAGTADEIAVVIGFGGYITRSYRERRAALALEGELEDVPITGEPAPPGTGPEDDPRHRGSRWSPPAAEAPADLDGEDIQWERME